MERSADFREAFSRGSGYRRAAKTARAGEGTYDFERRGRLNPLESYRVSERTYGLAFQAT